MSTTATYSFSNTAVSANTRPSTNSGFVYPNAVVGKTRTRLIKLKPAKSYHEEVVCKLIEGDIEQDEYDALSYAWGDLDDLVPMTCYHGRRRHPTPTLMVTRNCKKALVRIRHESKSILLWVDAICIDQSNERERAHQVSEMHNIYYNANHLYIYLDDRNVNSRLIDIANTLQGPAHVMLRLLGPRPKVAALESALKTLYIASWAVKPLAKAVKLDNLAKIFEYPWFERAWIIQEVVFGCGRAGNDPIILLGEHRLSWAVLVLLAKFLLERGEVLGHAHSNLLYINRAIIDRRLEFRSKHEGNWFNFFRSQSREPYFPLWELLSQTWTTTRAKEPNDKVISLMHMSQESADVHKKIIIDPEKRNAPVTSLLRRFAGIVFFESLYNFEARHAANPAWPMPSERQFEAFVKQASAIKTTLIRYCHEGLPNALSLAPPGFSFSKTQTRCRVKGMYSLIPDVPSPAATVEVAYASVLLPLESLKDIALLCSAAEELGSEQPNMESFRDAWSKLNTILRTETPKDDVYYSVRQVQDRRQQTDRVLVHLENTGPASTTRPYFAILLTPDLVPWLAEVEIKAAADTEVARRERLMAPLQFAMKPLRSNGQMLRSIPKDIAKRMLRSWKRKYFG